MYTYLLINLGVIFIPVMLSFEPRVCFVRRWPAVAVAAGIVGAFFCVWDHFFTVQGVWGFNARYLIGWRIGGLPVEEVLFFFCVPFSCLFLYEVVRYFWPAGRWPNAARGLARGLMALSLVLAVLHPDRIYPRLTFALLAVVLLAHLYLWRSDDLEVFFTMYAITLLPFLIVNGLLTNGIPAVDPGPVVWYNNAQNLGVRVMGIPVEDFFYSMCLLLMNVTVYEYVLRRRR